MSLDRQLEPEVMDTSEDAHDYDAMDHSNVNRRFVEDLLRAFPRLSGHILDVGAGPGHIAIELARQCPIVHVVAFDASEEMLKLACQHISKAGLAGRVVTQLGDARSLPGEWDGIISNSIIHHIPEPAEVLNAMVKAAKPGAAIFVRDLFRPPDQATLEHIVSLYAAHDSPRQRQLFADSLRAALTVAEVQQLVSDLGFPANTVAATSDRHWTWVTVKS